ncbi:MULTISPECIES: F0F1 ATP synthase subunit epsilon [Actinomyces]|uniref:F0F1 ATP synthase subunit epsilon n=1 Tax=Actinomyces respiraculi TaxID=2744574 RepID=A0A7T0LK16_9ACTO|nr:MULTISPECIES: F0F1 ATP synthase subunit epsilon [Actinomyces]QPL04856.1 F0F1 ATP synthase subunit epsilon [Actinomyces respiraculi]
MSSSRTLVVEVVSRHGGTAFAGEAASVSVPLADGELGVLPGRQPILALLGRGTVRVTLLDGTVERLEVAGGFCSVDHDVVTVAADRIGDEITGTAADFDLLAERVVDTASGDLD